MTIKLSAADSGNQTSPGRPRIWRTLPGSCGSGKLSNASVTGSNLTIEFDPKSLAHTVSVSSTKTA